MKKFGLVVDFGRKRLQWDERRWTQARQQNAGGHYLLDLAGDPSSFRREILKPSFVYAPDDLRQSPYDSLSEIGEATGHAREEKPDHPNDTTTKTLAPIKVRNICYTAENTATNVAKELKSTTALGQKKKVLGGLRCARFGVLLLAPQLCRSQTVQPSERLGPDRQNTPACFHGLDGRRTTRRDLALSDVWTMEPDPGAQLSDNRITHGPQTKEGLAPQTRPAVRPDSVQQASDGKGSCSLGAPPPRP
jgi:hypothetical protein